jgi:hypothetical protein
MSKYIDDRVDSFVNFYTNRVAAVRTQKRRTLGRVDQPLIRGPTIGMDVRKVDGVVVGIYPSSGWAERYEKSVSGVVQGNFKDFYPHAYQFNNTSYPWGTAFVDNAVGPLNFKYQGFNVSDGISMPDTPWPFAPWPSLDDTGLYNAALSRFNEQTRGSVDLSIDIAEYEQLISMARSQRKLVNGVANWVVTGSFQTVKPKSKAQYYRMRRQKKKKFKELASSATYKAINKGSAEAAHRWLEWQYGIRPLVSELFDIGEKFLQYQLNKTKRVRSVFTIPDNYVVRRNSGAQAVVDNAYTVFDGFRGVGFIVDLSNKGPVLSDFTSMNPLSIAWELYPFSFVADWIVNFSGFFRNAETAFLYSSRFIRGQSMKLQRNGMRTFEHTFSKVPGGNSYWIDVDGFSRQIRFVRTVLGSYPVPYPPKLEVKMGWQRLLSTAALLRTQLKVVTFK